LSAGESAVGAAFAGMLALATDNASLGVMMYSSASVSGLFADKRWPALDLGVRYLLVDFDGHEIDRKADFARAPAVARDNPRAAFALAMVLQRKHFTEEAILWYRHAIVAESVPAMNNRNWIGP
jgi:hypothetical protein